MKASVAFSHKKIAVYMLQTDQSIVYNKSEYPLKFALSLLMCSYLKSILTWEIFHQREKVFGRKFFAYDSVVVLRPFLKLLANSHKLDYFTSEMMKIWKFLRLILNVNLAYFYNFTDIFYSRM